jgi:hypothetical protein
MAENIFREAFSIDDTDILKGLEDVEKAIIRLQKESNDLAQEFVETFSGANDEIKGLAGTLGSAADQAASANARHAQSIQTVTKANQSWYQSVKQTIAGYQVGGKSLEEWGEQAKGFASKIDLAGKAQTAAAGGARLLGIALKATGIGALISLVGGAILYFTKFQAGMDSVSRVIGGAGAVVNELVKRFVSLGSGVGNVLSAIGNLITLDFDGFLDDSKTAANEFSGAVTGLGSALYDAAVAGAALEKQMQDLRDITIKQSVFAAQQRVELDKLKQVMDDGTLSISARVNATKQGAVIEKNLAEQALDRAEAAVRAEKERIRLSVDPSNVEGLQALAKAQIEQQEAIGEINKVNFDAEQKLRELRKEAAEEAKKAREKALKQLEDEQKALQKILKDIENLKVAITPEGIDKELAATQKRFDDLQALTTDGIKKLTEISARRSLTPKELAAFDELTGIYEGLETARQEALLDVVLSYAEKDIEIEKEIQKSKKALAERDIQAQKDSAKAVFDLRNQQTDISEEQFKGFIALLEANGTDEKVIAEKKFEFDKLVNEKRLEARLAFQESLLAIEEATGGAQVESIKLAIQKIKAEIDTLGATGQKEGKKGKDKKIDIWSLLGIDDEGKKEAFKQTVDLVVDGLKQISEARVREAEAAVQAAEDKVQAAEDALKKEEEDAKKGLANNSNLRKIDLENAKKSRETALKDEAKARKQQILLDSATQVSSLITASANIFKSFSGLGPIGPALAIGAIALMVGSFIKAKADALKAVNVPKLRKGDKIIGRTHEQGGELRELEHNEQVVGAAEAENQDLFFERMRQGRYKGIDLARMAERKTDRADPLGESVPRIRSLEQRRAAATEAQHTMLLAKTMESVGDRVVAAIMEKPEAYPWKNGYKQVTRTKSGKTTKTVLPAD